jgi:hypothetical protein
MSLVLYKLSNVPLPSGLPNKGATCWLNAVLQMFMSFPSLYELTKEITAGSCNKGFVKLFKKLCDDPAKAENLNKVYNYIIKEYGANSPTALNSHECALEGFDHILDSFQNHTSIEKLFLNVHLFSFNCSFCSNNVVSNRDTSYRVALNDPPENRDDFEKFILSSTEKMEKYFCEKCHHSMSDFMRTKSLRRVNEIQVFSLQKLTEKKVIPFPDQFTIPYGKGETTDALLLYKLVAKIEHSGTMNGGHYTAHCLRRIPNGAEPQWICFNDTEMSVGNGDPSPNTFVIAYHLMKIIS